MSQGIAIKLSTALLLVSIATSAPSLHLEGEWEAWKAQHGKTYTHKAEELERNGVWARNKDIVESHNAENEGGSYTLAMNRFGDMTDGEWRDLYLGAMPGPNVTKDNTKVFQMSSDSKPPKAVDWRSKKAVCPVKDQGQCNSSYAFSAMAALEGAVALQCSTHAEPFSEQNIIDCTVPYGNHGCNGGSVYNTYQYILSEGGVDMAINYPYHAKQEACYFDEDATTGRISGTVRITSGNEKHLQAAVAHVGPISVNVDASSTIFRFYYDGVFDSAYCSSTSLNHAMVVIGYGSTSKGKKYWIVKNSWGKSWGEGGYIRMARDSFNQCGIASDALYPTL